MLLTKILDFFNAFQITPFNKSKKYYTINLRLYYDNKKERKIMKSTIKMIIFLIIFALCLSGCSFYNTSSSPSLSSQSEKTPSQITLESSFSSSVPVAIETYETEYIYLQQNVADNTIAYGILSYNNLSLVSDIERLIWLVIRGFHNSGYTYKETSEIPEIVESDVLQSKVNDFGKGDIEGVCPTLIRIVYKEHSPKGTPAGGTPSNYKDIVLFVDSQNSDNMIFARQVLENPGTWEVFEIKDFGKWLEAEMDMIYRNYFSEYYRD